MLSVQKEVKIAFKTFLIGEINRWGNIFSKDINYSENNKLQSMLYILSDFELIFVMNQV